MRRPVTHGILAAAALTAVYLVIVSIAQGVPHALEQFASIWYLMVPLIAGFGVQIALFSHIHHAARVSPAGVATSGGVSTVSMVACCAHHVTDIAPLIGFTAAALFLTQYQNVFVVLGILSNLIGILFMLSIIQRNGMYRKGIFAYNMKKIMMVAIVLAVPILIGAFLFLSAPAGQVPVAPATISGVPNNPMQNTTMPMLGERANSENGLTITAAPKNFAFGAPVVFDMTFTTHQGSMDFDVTAVATLESGGTVYRARTWEGTGPGGHHRSGILTFPALEETPARMTLVIAEVYGIPERLFSWELA